MRNLRSLFYGSLFLLILTMGFVLVYFFVLYTTASGEQARDFVVFAGILVAPIVFVPLYWGYRSEYRPHRMTPEENKALSRGSALFAASSLALILGLSAWRKDSMSVSVVALAIYGALTAYYVRLLWRMHREKYARLIAEGLLQAPVQRLTRSQRSKLVVVITIGLAAALFAWTGIYFFYHGAIYLGTALVGVSGLLCFPMMRKLRKVSVLD